MPVLGKKRLNQTQIQVRKSKQIEPQRKKTRFSFLGTNEEVIYFKIPSTIQAYSPRIPNDCVICSLSFLKVISNAQATQLRIALLNRPYGVGISSEDIEHILTTKLKSKYDHIRHANIMFSTLDLLFHDIPRSHAIIVGLHPKDVNSIGHAVVLFKDMNGTLGLIDPQQDHICYDRDCVTYLSNYNPQTLTIFVGTPR